MKIIRNTDSLETLTPEILGEILANMGSDDQAEAFNAMAREAENWPKAATDQWVWTAEGLTQNAVQMLDDIVSFAKGEV